MKYPSINQVIFSTSRTIRLLAIITSAYLMGKFCWWLVNPLGYHTLDATTATSNTKADGVAQGIVNRAPFGVITVEKKEQPSIVSQIKVTGVYAGGAKNSIAFLLISGKNSIASLGDNVLGATLKSITPTGIVLSLNNQDIPINMSSGSGDSSSNTPNSPPPYSSPAPAVQAQQINNAPVQANNNVATPAPDAGNADGDSLADKRRKMIEAFQHQNQDQNANNNQPNN